MTDTASTKTIAIGSVANGFGLKSAIHTHLTNQGHRVLDMGCHGTDGFVEYTSIGEAVAGALHSGEADFGIVCCNFGCSACTGVSKFKSVIAFASESIRTAEMCRKVNNANVLCMGNSVVSQELACRMADVFIGSQFLDLEGVPQKVLDFRRRASEQVIAHGRLHASQNE